MLIHLKFIRLLKKFRGLFHLIIFIIKNMKKYLLVLLLITSNILYSQSTCDSLLVYDRVENWTWFGLWSTPANTGYYTNVSVSPNASAAIIGAGLGTSGVEQNTYVLPNVAVNPNFQHIFRFRLGSYRISSTAASSGVDGPDNVDVRLSTNNGVTYFTEMRITGFGGAYWNYNTNATASKTANGTTLTTFSPIAGGDRTNTGDGYSVIELRIPAGVSNIAINLLCRVNAAGEEWWIDDMELIQMIPRPNNPIVTIPTVDTSICFGESINLTANSNIGTLEWFELASGGLAIATGNTFTTPILNQNTSYWVQSNNAGCLSNRTQTNILTENCLFPLELIDFYGKEYNNTVELFWETANEVNTDYFVIEKSYDATEWEQIGTTPAAGNYQYNLAYNFTDEFPKNGNNYYRLKQYDADGSYETYHIINVNVENADNPIISHSNGILSLNGIQSYHKYKLISTNGIVISEQNINANNLSLETNYIPNGLYILLLMKSDNSFETYKLYIKN